MEKEKLVVGDLVKLNSGGPLMTVGSIDKNDVLWCVWDYDYNQKGDMRQYGFAEAMLYKVNKED